MALILPPYVQYQAPLVPVTGRWNRTPPEGDKFVNLEFDWGVNAGPNSCVQISLSAGNIVPITQICAVAADNSRCGVDVQLIFPDTGFTLNIPARSNGVFPVFTNAIGFFALAQGAASPDVTVIGVLNSVPPPVALAPTAAQSLAASGALSVAANASYQLVGGGQNGELEAFSIVLSGTAGGGGAVCTLALVDGSATPVVIWSGAATIPAGTTADRQYSLTGLRARFFNGLAFRVSGTTITAGNAVACVYYSQP